MKEILLMIVNMVLVLFLQNPINILEVGLMIYLMAKEFLKMFPMVI